MEGKQALLTRPLDSPFKYSIFSSRGALGALHGNWSSDTRHSHCVPFYALHCYLMLGWSSGWQCYSDCSLMAW